jgi:hypothetical protein
VALRPHSVIESFAELADLTREERCSLSRFRIPALSKYRWISEAVGPAVFLAWMLIFGMVTEILDDHPGWDLLGYLSRQGWLGILAALLMGYGLAILLGVVCHRAVRVTLLRRAITRALDQSRCLWCDYSLEGHAAYSGKVRCPECGEHAPVRISVRSVPDNGFREES